MKDKHFNEGLDTALDGIESTIEDYTEHYSDMYVDKATAREIINTLDTLKSALEHERKDDGNKIINIGGNKND